MSQNLNDQAKGAILERIPKWLASVAFALFIVLLIISYFTGKRISWTPLGFVDPPQTMPETPIISTIPTGAVMAFDLEICPLGWEDYEEAYGRFIRGIDKSGGKVDPLGRREPGATQEDDFKSHNHTITAQKPLVHREYGGGRCEDLNPGGWACHTELTINHRGGDETRPKNVSLLYCKKVQPSRESSHG